MLIFSSVNTNTRMICLHTTTAADAVLTIIAVATHTACRYTDHHDAVPGTGTRYSSFRRVGAELQGAQMPGKVNLLPFLAAIKAMWPGDALQVGPWLGQVAFGTELYDHCSGNVVFHDAPTFKAELLHAAED